MARTEPREQTTAGICDFEVYNGTEVPAVVDQFKTKLPDSFGRFRPAELWLYFDGKNWKCGNNQDDVQDRCDEEKEVAT